MIECYVVKYHDGGYIDSIYLSFDYARLRLQTLLTDPHYRKGDFYIHISKIYDLEDLRDDVC